MSADSARFARATYYANAASPDVVEHELQVFRGQCNLKNGERKRFFKLAAGSALGLGLGGFLIGAMSGNGGTIGIGGIGLGLVLTITFIVMGVSVAPYRDGKRLEKISDLLRSLDLAPGAPVAVGCDFLELREEPHLSPPAVQQIAQLPKAFVVGRPWCTARVTLANGLELTLVRSARTYAFTSNRNGTSHTSYSYWLVDAVSITYDPRRFPQLAAAGAGVQRHIVIPQGWEPVSFFAGPGTIAVAAITQHKYAEPDYNPRGALALARQLTALADPSRAVVALTPQRAADPAADLAIPVRAPVVPARTLMIAGLAIGVLGGGFSSLLLAESIERVVTRSADVDEAERDLSQAKKAGKRDVAHEKEKLERKQEYLGDAWSGLAFWAAGAVVGLGLAGYSGYRLRRARRGRSNAAPTSSRGGAGPAAVGLPIPGR